MSDLIQVKDVVEKVTKYLEIVWTLRKRKFGIIDKITSR